MILCYFGYKIISKVLTNRLKTYLAELITPYQSAFVAGKRIQYNILITHKMFHFLKKRRRGSGIPRQTEFALKIDMQKAYDRVEWNFLLEILERRRFCEQWIGWIKACNSTVTYQVIVNGNRTRVIIPTSGLRQGDPLSPISLYWSLMFYQE